MVAGDEEYPDPTKYLFISLEQKRKDQTKPYDGKKMFWIPDDKECYVLCSLVSEKDGVCTLELGREGGGEKVRLYLERDQNFSNCSNKFFHSNFFEWEWRLLDCINMYYILIICVYIVETMQER